jgi:hypothetical protein
MTTDNESIDNIEQPDKTPRLRSVAYPSYTLEASIELTEKIDKKFSDVVYSSRDAISKNLNLSGGALLMNLSSCVQYGILEMKQTVGYKPTAIYKKIKRPLPDEKLTDTYLECFKNPELYKKLIRDFGGKELPEESGLSNILDRNYGVVGNASSIAAKTFFKNLEFIGLIGSDNIFTVEVGSDNGLKDIKKDEAKFKGEPPPPKPPLGLPLSTTLSDIEIPVFLKGGRQAKIVIPGDFSDEDIARISKVINGYVV